MSVGGNGRARQFFKQHGWSELGADKIEQKVLSHVSALLTSRNLVVEGDTDIIVPAYQGRCQPLCQQRSRHLVLMWCRCCLGVIDGFVA